MAEPTATPRFTLRALPLPAKLVITLFMLTVGLGYSSALVQMHFQHTQADGSPMPGVEDVIEIFAGKRWITKEEAAAARPKSKFELLVAGPKDVLSGTSMGAAFFQKDPTKEYTKLTTADGRKPVPELQAKVDPDREGERTVLQLWSQLPEEEQKKAYESDSFTLPVDKLPAALTAKFHDGAAVKVKSIIAARCVECHQPGGTKDDVPLDTYAGLAKYAVSPPPVVIPDGAAGAWCVSTRQISKEKLAQSTHAHLLSFAMLFALTGLVFSFTSWPGWIRGIVGPMVLLAQVADVSCWWLARLDGPGIYFAQAIMATGAVVGMGLTIQILGSVFNMYGRTGKFVLVLLFLAAMTAGGVVVMKIAIPELQAQKVKKLQQAEDAKKKADEAAKPPVAVAPAPGPAGKKIVPVPPPQPPMMSPSKLEKQLTGNWEKALDMKLWPMNNVVPDGSMVRAFFDKETDFKDVMKKKAEMPDAFKTIVAERESEQSVVIAWIRAKPEDRKKAFEKDEFPLPPEMKGKPMTAEFIANDKAVKIKSILDSRCSSCHGAGTKVELETYDALEKFLK